MTSRNTALYSTFSRKLSTATVDLPGDGVGLPLGLSSERASERVWRASEISSIAFFLCTNFQTTNIAFIRLAA